MLYYSIMPYTVSLGARYIKDCAQLQHIINPIAAVVGSGCDYTISFFNQTEKEFTNVYYGMQIILMH